MYNKLFESEERKRRGKRNKDRHNRSFNLPRRHEKTQQLYNKLFGDEAVKKEYVELDYTMDGSVKQLFLNLTKMQIPFNYEKTLAKYFPEDMEVDGHGNYFKKIGDNDIMFCGHLDTYCKEHKRVWHIIDGDTITSDGTTTLGGDDKAGITVMIKMMEAGVPGLYYFFRGEEGVTSPTGTWGSKQALKSRKDFFSNIKKCIAFDRKGTSSIISEQMYTQCCSDEFVKALEEEFKKNGLEYKDDPTGMWCDSGVFMEMVPECTNISVGYKSEHTFFEEQNIKHLEKLVEVAINIDWESLPVKRDPSKVTRSIGRYNYDYDWGWEGYTSTDKYGRGGKYSKTDKLMGTTSAAYSSREQTRRDYVSMEDVFYHIVEILDQLDYECLNEEAFSEAEEMYFTNYKNGDFFGIRIIDYEIYMSEDETLKKYTNYGNLANFSKYVVSGINPNEIEDGDEILDLDKELDRKLGKQEKDTKRNDGYLYTKQQMDTFENVAENNVELVKMIMDDVSSTNKKVPAHNIWLKVDDALTTMKYKVDYSVHGSGINPDSFIEWVSDHWLEMQDLIEVTAKKDTNKTTAIKDVINTAKGGFLPELKNSNIAGTKYHYDEYQMFSKLIEKVPELVKMVLMDFEINDKAEVRDSTIKKIWDELTNMDYKRSDKTVFTAYPEKFVKWVHEYSDEIKKYLKMNK
jgi:hypothetical protein